MRLGLTGEALIPAAAAAPAPADAGQALVPATSVFHQGDAPAVWIVRPADSTLELRPVSVGGYRERTAVITKGLRDGDVIVAAGVHTVFAGETVTATAPLFAAPDARAPAAPGKGHP